MIDEHVKQTQELLSRMVANITLLSMLKMATEVPDFKQKMVEDITQLEPQFLKYFHKEKGQYAVIETLFVLLHIDDDEIAKGLQRMAEVLSKEDNVLMHAHADDGRITVEGIELIQATTLDLDQCVRDCVRVIQESVPQNAKEIFNHLNTVQ